ncbi:unnamed protein product [Toxocara canis]|uniref:Uncharacterized protein n=1 Tax=Toxocara canis TaxID=6265 RepID=A0A183U5U6_TOXCA|nr:unnamed protein product [Toxocara canis]
MIKVIKLIKVIRVIKVIKVINVIKVTNVIKDRSVCVGKLDDKTVVQSMRSLEERSSGAAIGQNAQQSRVSRLLMGPLLELGYVFV